MKGRLHVINQKHKNILIVLSLVILILVCYSQYKEKRMYQAHISMELNHDIALLLSGIANTNRYYEDILNSGEITKRHVSVLKAYSSDIGIYYEKIKDLGFKFNRLESKNGEYKTFARAERKIFGFTVELDDQDFYELEEMDDILYQLESPMKKEVQHIKALTLLWGKAAQRSVVGVTVTNNQVSFNGTKFYDEYGDQSSISSDHWIDLIISLNEETNNYLKTHKIHSFENFLVGNK